MREYINVYSESQQLWINDTNTEIMLLSIFIEGNA